MLRYTWIVIGLAACAAPEPESTKDIELLGGGQEPAAALFERHCAACHGTRGAGDGPIAQYCFPPPRDFGTGQFLLVTGLRQGPSHSDLTRTILGGLPGSAMPAFRWLPGEDVARLADHVLELTEERLAARLVFEAEQEGRELPLRRARGEASRRLRPGPTASTPPALEPSDLELGRAVFEEHCAACHGSDGRGFDLPPQRLPNGTLAWARDFTAGVLKGGALRDALGARITCGMPAGGMPATRLPDDELAALLDHVTSLIQPETVDLHRMQRGQLRARRVDRLPRVADDPLWDQALPIEVTLAALDWRREAIRSVDLFALHDGTELALRLRWQDSTQDDRLIGEGALPDACALMLSEAFDPPLDGMGSAAAPVRVWHWRAAVWEDVAGTLDLFFHRPDGGVGAQHDGAAPSLTPSGDDLRTLEARGAARVERTGELTGLRARASWGEGSWNVVLVRRLDPGEPGAIPMVPGSTVSVAPAVWNGAAGDAGPRKSFGLWQTLVIER